MEFNGKLKKVIDERSDSIGIHHLCDKREPKVKILDTGIKVDEVVRIILRKKSLKE